MFQSPIGPGDLGSGTREKSGWFDYIVRESLTPVSRRLFTDEPEHREEIVIDSSNPLHLEYDKGIRIFSKDMSHFITTGAPELFPSGVNFVYSHLFRESVRVLWAQMLEPGDTPSKVIQKSQEEYFGKMSEKEITDDRGRKSKLRYRRISQNAKQILREELYAAYSRLSRSDPLFRRILMSTKGRPIYYIPGRDTFLPHDETFLGLNFKRNGQNVLGETLRQVRDEIYVMDKLDSTEYARYNSNIEMFSYFYYRYKFFNDKFGKGYIPSVNEFQESWESVVSSSKITITREFIERYDTFLKEYVRGTRVSRDAYLSSNTGINHVIQDYARYKSRYNPLEVPKWLERLYRQSFTLRALGIVFLESSGEYDWYHFVYALGREAVVEDFLNTIRAASPGLSVDSSAFKESFEVYLVEKGITTETISNIGLETFYPKVVQYMTNETQFFSAGMDMLAWNRRYNPERMSREDFETAFVTNKINLPVARNDIIRLGISATHFKPVDLDARKVGVLNTLMNIPALNPRKITNHTAYSEWMTKDVNTTGRVFSHIRDGDVYTEALMKGMEIVTGERVSRTKRRGARFYMNLYPEFTLFNHPTDPNFAADVLLKIMDASIDHRRSVLYALTLNKIQRGEKFRCIEPRVLELWIAMCIKDTEHNIDHPSSRVFVERTLHRLGKLAAKTYKDYSGSRNIIIRNHSGGRDSETVVQERTDGGVKNYVKRVKDVLEPYTLEHLHNVMNDPLMFDHSALNTVRHLSSLLELLCACEIGASGAIVEEGDTNPLTVFEDRGLPKLEGLEKNILIYGYVQWLIDTHRVRKSEVTDLGKKYTAATYETREDVVDDSRAFYMGGLSLWSSHYYSITKTGFDAIFERDIPKSSRFIPLFVASSSDEVVKAMEDVANIIEYGDLTETLYEIGVSLHFDSGNADELAQPIFLGDSIAVPGNISKFTQLAMSEIGRKDYINTIQRSLLQRLVETREFTDNAWFMNKLMETRDKIEDENRDAMIFSSRNKTLSSSSREVVDNVLMNTLDVKTTYHGDLVTIEGRDEDVFPVPSGTNSGTCGCSDGLEIPSGPWDSDNDDEEEGGEEEDTHTKHDEIVSILSTDIIDPIVVEHIHRERIGLVDDFSENVMRDIRLPRNSVIVGNIDDNISRPYEFNVSTKHEILSPEFIQTNRIRVTRRVYDKNRADRKEYSYPSVSHYVFSELARHENLPEDASEPDWVSQFGSDFDRLRNSIHARVSDISQKIFGQMYTLYIRQRLSDDRRLFSIIAAVKSGSAKVRYSSAYVTPQVEEMCSKIIESVANEYEFAIRGKGGRDIQHVKAEGGTKKIVYIEDIGAGNIQYKPISHPNDVYSSIRRRTKKLIDLIVGYLKMKLGDSVGDPVEVIHFDAAEFDKITKAFSKSCETVIRTNDIYMDEIPNTEFIKFVKDVTESSLHRFFPPHDPNAIEFIDMQTIMEERDREMLKGGFDKYDLPSLIEYLNTRESSIDDSIDRILGQIRRGFVVRVVALRGDAGKLTKIVNATIKEIKGLVSDVDDKNLDDFKSSLLEFASKILDDITTVEGALNVSERDDAKEVFNVVKRWKWKIRPPKRRMVVQYATLSKMLWNNALSNVYASVLLSKHGGLGFHIFDRKSIVAAFNASVSSSRLKAATTKIFDVGNRLPKHLTPALLFKEFLFAFKYVFDTVVNHSGSRRLARYKYSIIYSALFNVGDMDEYFDEPDLESAVKISASEPEPSVNTFRKTSKIVEAVKMVIPNIEKEWVSVFETMYRRYSYVIDVIHDKSKQVRTEARRYCTFVLLNIKSLSAFSIIYSDGGKYTDRVDVAALMDQGNV